ncbi:MAG: hypothetical protein ACW99U_20930 [Candidatus Thorarchaeota archaeon]|jgi:hypothetical protein
MINSHTGEKEILVLDFDGVIHSYVSGWHGADVANDPPVPGVYEFIVEASSEFQICIISARSSQPGGILCMCTYLRDKVNLPEDILEEIWFPTTKPPAHLWIDDRAFCFRGAWPSIEELINFKPWNK